MNNNDVVACRPQTMSSLLPVIDGAHISDPESVVAFSEMMESPKTTGRVVGRDRRKTRFNYFIMLALSIGVFLGLYSYLRESTIESNVALSANKKHHGWNQMETTHDTLLHSNSTTPTKNEPHSPSGNIISYAPLFYHISPGSTGSRTLFHAACKSGFPSVHHKSFCNSQTRGIHDVADSVVQGMRAHYELLRLYEMAFECSRLWSKGKIRMVDGNVVIILDHANNTSVTEQLCNTPLDEWTSDVQTHLTTVIQSGLVGLFDTPYPYLAPKVLELADTWREQAHPIIAMTERDPKGWANSRSKNHGMMVCREEYSYGKLGASEFDVLGCVDRAYSASSSLARSNGEDSNDLQSHHSTVVLHFWDVFRYRSSGDTIDPEFQLGMERQMEHHQELYLPMSQYTPDMFGMQAPSSKNESATRINEKDFAVDIRKLILGEKQADRAVVGSTSSIAKLQSIWRDSYTKPLTCRGRVNWEMVNDTLIEIYHLPKTCEVPAKARKAKLDTASGRMIPLIP